MSRIRKSVPPVGEEVEINKIREMVRAELCKRYGSVAAFLNTEMGEKLGGHKVRPYLYNSGTISLKVINDFCKYLGIGELTRKLVVTRTYTYQFIPTPTTSKITS